MAVKIYNVGVSNIRVREQGVFTAPELITDAGLYIESAGGYYAGANIIVGSKEYAIIIAPKELGESSIQLRWKFTRDTTGTLSTYDGKANMTAIEAAGISNHPAAEYCANLNINGFNDWHLPAPDELEACYRYLKPTTSSNIVETITLHNAVTGTNPNSNPVGLAYNGQTPGQTSQIAFQSGGDQVFISGRYWSSLEQSDSRAWAQNFDNGYQGSYTKTFTYDTRAVRWLEV